MIIDPEIGLPPPSTVPEIDFPTGVGVAVGVGVILALAELLGVGVAVGVALKVGVGVGLALGDDVGVGVPLLTKGAMPSPLPPQPEIPIIRQTTIDNNVEGFEKTAITIPLNKPAHTVDEVSHLLIVLKKNCES